MGTIDTLHRAAERSVRTADPYHRLMQLVGSADVVLIGEASHGTHEFYHERAALTKRLIAEHGFSAVALEADWPDALRVNRFVRNEGADADAVDSLAGFKRFPTWMWRNADVLDFAGWLREYNTNLAIERQAGIYGLDLYSLQASMEAVVAYLDRVDPAAARRAREGYACFETVGDPSEYGYAVGWGLHASCREDVMRTLLELRTHAGDYLQLDGRTASDEYFYALQNARVAHDAEAYYRTMIEPGVSSWNLRDRHMFDTLLQLREHLTRNRTSAKIVVWAHNSHVGDAAATDMARRGEFNIGSLLRSESALHCRRIGFTTYTGTVSAAADWGSPVERKNIRPALAGSYEELFHRVGVPRFLLYFDEHDVREACRGPLMERAIGVIYRPETERKSHYFAARLTPQFDAVMHIDRTRAVEPLERTQTWDKGEVAETYPTGV